MFQLLTHIKNPVTFKQVLNVNLIPQKRFFSTAIQLPKGISTVPQISLNEIRDNDGARKEVSQTLNQSLVYNSNKLINKN